MGFNFVQAGSSLTIPAPGAVSSGSVVIAGSIVGIAAGSAGAGDAIDVIVTGVFDLPKVAADDVALGAVVYYDDATGLVTLTDTDNTKLGVAVAAAAATTGTVRVRLSGF